MAEKGFKVLTVKEKYYKKVRDYYRNIVDEEIDAARFISETRIVQEEIKKNKTTNHISILDSAGNFIWLVMVEKIYIIWLNTSSNIHCSRISVT